MTKYRAIVLCDLSYSLAGVIPDGTEVIGEVLKSFNGGADAFLVTDGRFQEVIIGDVDNLALIEDVEP